MRDEVLVVRMKVARMRHGRRRFYTAVDETRLPRESAIEFWPLGEVCELSCWFSLPSVLASVLGSEHYFEKLVPVCVCNAPPVVSTLVFIHGIYVMFC